MGAAHNLRQRGSFFEAGLLLARTVNDNEHFDSACRIESACRTASMDKTESPRAATAMVSDAVPFFRFSFG